MILDKILQDKRAEVDYRSSSRPLDELLAVIRDLPSARDFVSALTSCPGRTARVPMDRVRLIAEVKKASPSKGLIRPDFDPVTIAKRYEESGASAISVLTDEKYFQGKLEYLQMVHSAVKIPCLRKDFIIDRYQVYEARAAEADAILLIVAALSKEDISSLMALTSELGMASLVETHNAAEMEIALEIGAKVIGINNRDLQTFHTTIDTSIKLAADVPGDRILVAESGIFTRSDVDSLAAVGIDAILVGESLMRESDPGTKIEELIGIG